MGIKELATTFVPCGHAPLLTRSVARRLGYKGQAFVELALGMFALALVLSALLGFADYILRSLAIQRVIRADAGRDALTAIGGAESYASRRERDAMVVEPFAAEYVFGSSEVEVKEEVHIPAMSGLDL